MFSITHGAVKEFIEEYPGIQPIYDELTRPELFKDFDLSEELAYHPIKPGFTKIVYRNNGANRELYKNSPCLFDKIKRGHYSFNQLYHIFADIYGNLNCVKKYGSLTECNNARRSWYKRILEIFTQRDRSPVKICDPFIDLLLESNKPMFNRLRQYPSVMDKQSIETLYHDITKEIMKTTIFYDQILKIFLQKLNESNNKQMVQYWVIAMIFVFNRNGATFKDNSHHAILYYKKA